MERTIRVFTLAFSQGVAAMRRHPRKAIAASLAYWLPALALILNFGPLLGLGTLGRKLVQPIVYLFFVPVCTVLYVALIAAVGRPRRARALERALLRAGVVNHNNEPPIVTAVDDKSMTLYMGGADPTALLDNLALEAALCLKIGAVSEGRDNRFVIVKTAPAARSSPTMSTSLGIRSQRTLRSCWASRLWGRSASTSTKSPTSSSAVRLAAVRPCW